MQKGLKWISYLTCAGMFMVLLAGALVTNTNSGRGCGSDWPLCNGKFVPAYTLESFIEYSHRMVTGFVGILVILTLIAVWKFAANHRKEALFYAWSTLGFTVLQALMGAAAVIWEQSSAVLALHFGISLLAFASTLLLAILVGRGQTSASSRQLSTSQPAPRIPSSFRWLVWGVGIYSYVVVYLGAFVRHTKSSGGCTGWPLCNGEVVPKLSGATGIVFTHRLAAVVLLILMIWMTSIAVKRFKQFGDLYKASVTALVLCICQIFSGGFLVASMNNKDTYIFAGLLHTTIIACLFGVLCFLCIRVWQLRTH